MKKVKASIVVPFCASCLMIQAQEPAPPAPPAAATPPAAPGAAEQAMAAFTQLANALQAGDFETVAKLTEGKEDPQSRHFRAEALQGRAVKRFFDADIQGSIRDFDEFVKLRPSIDPHLWQRGIAYYYAGKYQEGKEQFERHQTVNSQDVENAVWHFICAVRAPGGSVEAARKNFIAITEDTRVPMKEVHELFAGTGTSEAVLKAAEKTGNPARSPVAKNAMLYAHLYLGLYYEATGHEDLARQHIGLAAGEFHMDHYMGNVAVVHAKLRNIPVTPAK